MEIAIVTPILLLSLLFSDFFAPTFAIVTPVQNMPALPFAIVASFQKI